MLAHLGYGALGVLIGSAVGFLVPAVFVAASDWHSSHIVRPPTPVVQSLLTFGLPLAGVFALGVVTSWSDRILLGSFAGTTTVGQYAAATDLTSQTIIALMRVCSMSATPLTIRAYEAAGPAGAAARLREHGVLLMSVALPATVGLAMLAPRVSRVVLGGPFQEAAAVLMPPIAVGSLLSGMKAFYFDLAFQLGNATGRQLRISVWSAALNVALNLLMIPRVGPIGAAYAMVATFVVACVLSAVVGRRAFAVPFPLGQWTRIALATGMMVAALWPIRGAGGGGVALILTILWGAFAYLIAVVLLNVGGARASLARAFRPAGGTITPSSSPPEGV